MSESESDAPSSFALTAVRGIHRHGEKSRRFRWAMILTAGTLGFPTCVTMRFLSSKLCNFYHLSYTRAYYCRDVAPTIGSMSYSSRTVSRSTFRT